MPGPLVQQQKSMLELDGLGPTDTTPSVTLGAVLAPCGLLQLDILSTANNDTFDILIEIQEGSAKGVKAFPM